MGDSHRFSGPQFRADGAEEQEAVRTTIVGGRPPGSGQPVGPIPRGLEVLIKKAAVDPDFRGVLLTHRAAAAERIGLKLDPAEAMMLAAAPVAQLEAVIDRTSVPQEHRRAFLGTAAAAMLAALGFSMAGCGQGPAPAGERPDKPATTKGVQPDVPRGARPDMPPEATIIEEEASAAPSELPRDRLRSYGIQPDSPPVPPPAPTGIRPDMPAPPGSARPGAGG